MRNKEKELSRVNNKVGNSIQDIYDYNNRKKTYWGELESVYNSLANGILMSLETLKACQEKLGLSLENHNRAEQKILINGYVKDIETFVDKLIFIHRQHDHKTGEIIGDEDYILSIKLGQDYNGVSIEFANITTPIFANILQNFSSGAETNGIIDTTSAKEEIMKESNVVDAVIVSETTKGNNQ